MSQKPLKRDAIRLAAEDARSGCLITIIVALLMVLLCDYVYHGFFSCQAARIDYFDTPSHVVHFVGDVWLVPNEDPVRIKAVVIPAHCTSELLWFYKGYRYNASKGEREITVPVSSPEPSNVCAAFAPATAIKQCLTIFVSK